MSQPNPRHRPPWAPAPEQHSTVPPAPISPPPGQVYGAPPGPRRRRRWIIAAVVAAVLAAGSVAATMTLSGGGHRSGDSANTSASPVSGPPAAAQVECTNIDRAYTAWSRGAIGVPTDASALNDLIVKSAMDDGKSFLDDVEGYPDRASKNLAVAIAEYNVNVGAVNLFIGVNGAAEQKDVDAVVASAAKVQSAYDAFKGAVCESK